MATRCPISFKPYDGEGKYSQEGLKRLSPKLEKLEDLTLTAEQLRVEAGARPVKLSISGVQPKLSAKLSIKKQAFEVTTIGGHYILKPQNQGFIEIPQNEALTMSMAAECGIDVPLHGLIYAADQSMVYFVKRFDRIGKKKLHVEDFSQLFGQPRDKKYSLSLEKAAKALDLCSFPILEKQVFYHRVLFNYLVGNEDAHLKNWSLITDAKGVIRLAPAYDLVNTVIATKSEEECALILRARKNRLRPEDLTEYLGEERLGLKSGAIANILISLNQAYPTWRIMIRDSFLSKEMQDRYMEYLEEKTNTLFEGNPYLNHIS